MTKQTQQPKDQDVDQEAGGLSEEVSWHSEGVEEPLLGYAKDEEEVTCCKTTPAVLKRSCTVLTFPFRLLWNNGIVSMIIAQAAIAMGASLVKYLDIVGVPIMEALIVRAIVGLLLCYVLCKLGGVKSMLLPRDLVGLVILRASIAGMGVACVFLGFRMIPTGDAMALSKLACITTILLTWILGWESINWIMWVGAIVTGVGGVVVAHPPLLFGGNAEWSSNRLVGVLLALCSTIFFSLGGMSVGKIGTRINTLVLGMWIQLGIFPAPIILLAVSYPDALVLRLSLSQCASIAMFTAFVLFGRILELRSFQLCNAALGNTLGTSSIVFSYAFGYLLLEEKISMFAVIGTISIFLGVWVVAVGKNKSMGAIADQETVNGEA